MYHPFIFPRARDFSARHAIAFFSIVKISTFRNANASNVRIAVYKIYDTLFFSFRQPFLDEFEKMFSDFSFFSDFLSFSSFCFRRISEKNAVRSAEHSASFTPPTTSVV